MENFDSAKWMNNYTEGIINESELNVPIDKKITYFESLILHVSNSTVISSSIEIKNYKLEHYYNFFTIIVNNITDLYCNNDLTQTQKYKLNALLTNSLLFKLTKLKKGHILLHDLKNIIKKILSSSDILGFIRYASKCGTFITFLFWLSLHNGITNISSNDLENIYSNAISNSDDRIYKYLTNYILKQDKLYFQKKKFVIQNLMSALSRSLVPYKYQLKRIKFLSQQVSLIPYFSQMISAFTNEKVLHEIHKYYYINTPNIHTFNTLSSLISSFINYGILSQEIIVKYLDMLKTDDEKTIFQIILSLLTEEYEFIVNMTLLEKHVVNNYKSILQTVVWESFIMKVIENKGINVQILNILTKYNLITKFIEENPSYLYSSDYKILLFTRFINIKTKNLINKVVIINNFLHKLRIIIKKKSKGKQIQYKVKMFDLLNELVNFKPNKQKLVLANGSINYQYNKQKFTNLPPRHLLPNELSIYTNYLLREKADGILINNLPIGIYPDCNLLKNYQIKAEYIEDLDLYLVFDIDIPNTTLIERYLILRNAHFMTTNTKISSINNLSDFIDIFNSERININNFLKDHNDHLIKWYPKFACQSNNKNMFNELINFITESNETIINSKPYSCDGLILTPLNGDREIKIKPLELMTIDLLYKNDKWVDRNNNDWSNYIIKTKKCKDNKIYRCYPKNNKFIIGEIRFDKKYPNTYSIICSILNILKHNWNYEILDNKNYYYDESNKIISSKIIESLNQQLSILESYIDSIKPLINKNWLDLGCGKGKLISIIKKYNPKFYMGLDIDTKQLVKCLKYHDENQDVYQFNPINLNEKWDNIKWYDFRDYKFDYIVANFSLMHFCTNTFWEQLNSIVHSDSIFIFNLINPTSDNWYESNSFLNIKDDIVEYKFEWTHNDIKTEPLITDTLLMSMLEKYEWKLINKVSQTTKLKLINCYNWYVIQKL
jgi:SAM-dependent methyltransferase